MNHLYFRWTIPLISNIAGVVNLWEGRCYSYFIIPTLADFSYSWKAESGTLDVFLLFTSRASLVASGNREEQRFQPI
jgi:hypothetical protein